MKHSHRLEFLLDKLGKGQNTLNAREQSLESSNRLVIQAMTRV
jgi:hypothetical protein